MIMPMNKYRTNDATTEPVTLAEMKEQLGISSTFSDTKIGRNYKAARQMVEKDTDRSLISQTWRVTLDAWPTSGVIFLPNGRLISVASLKYIDSDGDEQTLAENTHFVVHSKSDVARIVEADNQSWPSLHATRKEVVEIIYTAGYGTTADDVPDWAKEAIIAKATELYEVGQVSTEKMYQSLIDPHRLIFNYAINY